MSENCKYGRQATSNTEAMTPSMAATFTGIKRKTIERHRAGKCACTKPLSKDN
jgi:hypothetical protein